ncbi:MAG: lichenysin synthetase, partial [bacterium]|nr:lichenysin synthetase [bacterium]
MTASGKTDRKALPQPGSRHSREGYAAPRNEREDMLVRVWQDVLGVPLIGIDDNFFRVGGDSIKAIQVASRLKQHGWELKINDLFSHPVIGELRKYITRIKRSIPQETVTGKVRLTPIQQWYFKSVYRHGQHFNQAVMLCRENGFDQEVLDQTLTALVKHHDALRMQFHLSPDGSTVDSTDSTIIQENRGILDPLFELEVFRFDSSITG